MISVAVDNSVLGDLTDFNIPENKKKDKIAFEEIIKLDMNGKVEIGLALSAALIEERAAGEYKRKHLRSLMGSAFRIWPIVATNHRNDKLQSQKDCLKNIMQDKDGTDSENLISSTLHTPYFITTDYKYKRRFCIQKKRIQEKCGINVEVLTPSEFLYKFKSGTLENDVNC